MNKINDEQNFGKGNVSKQPHLVWTMVNVTNTLQKGDAHVITIDNQKNILIDAGHQDTAGESLLPYLKKNSIKEFDTVFISHPHKDHYGGLDVLLDNDIAIKKIYFNLPDKARCDCELPWGCDYEDVLRIRYKLMNRGVKIYAAKAGQKINFGEKTSIEILYAFNGVETPVGKTDINDTSLVMKLHHGQTKFLFTGDLNKKIGTYLAKTSNDISADVLKVPHHAIESLAPNDFFRKVSPRYALISTPKEYWLSKQSARVRSWFAENKIPVFVNGILGNIQITVCQNELSIQSAV